MAFASFQVVVEQQLHYSPMNICLDLNKPHKFVVFIVCVHCVN